MNISHKSSLKISNMGFICATLVVLRHIPALPDKSSALWWIVNFFDGLTLIAVPYFFLISGYFLSKHISDNSSWYRKEVLKRIKSIIIPFIIWNILYIIYFFLLNSIARCLGYSTHINPPDVTSVGGIITALGLNPMANCFHEHLWYLRTLFIFVLISPLLVLCIKKINSLIHFILVYAIILSPWFLICWNWQFTVFFEFFFNLLGMACFMFGMWLNGKENDINLNNLFCHTAMFSGIIIILLRTFFLFRDITILPMCLTWFIVPFILYGIWMIMPDYSIFGQLGKYSFPLYLLHGFVSLPLAAIIRIIFNNGEQNNSIVLYFIRWGIVIIFTLLFVKFFKMHFPRFYCIVFGGRG